MLVLFLITALQASEETGDLTGVPQLNPNDANMQTFEPQVCALWDHMGSARRNAEVGAQIAIFTQGWVGGRNCNKKGYLGDDFVHAALMTHNPNTKLMTLDYFSSTLKRNVQVILPERDLKKIVAEKTNFKTFKTYKEIRYQFTVGIEHSTSNRASTITFMRANYRTRAHMDVVCRKREDQTCKNNPPGVGKDGGFRCFCNNGYKCTGCDSEAGYAPHKNDALASCAAPGTTDCYSWDGATDNTAAITGATLGSPLFIGATGSAKPFEGRVITITSDLSITDGTAAKILKLFADHAVAGEGVPLQPSACSAAIPTR